MKWLILLSVVGCWPLLGSGPVYAQQLKLSLAGHTDQVQAVALSPDGKLIASGGGARDKSVRLWDAITGKELGVLKDAHGGGVNTVSFSPDGKTMASCGDDEVKLWDVATRASTATIKVTAVSCAVFHPDGKRLVLGYIYHQSGDVVTVYDLGTKKHDFLRGNTNSVQAVAVEPGGRFIAAAPVKDESVKLWDLSNGKQYTLSTSVGPISGLAFSPDGKTLACGGLDPDVELWDVARREHTASLKRKERAIFEAVAYRPDGKVLAVGYLTEDGKKAELTLWDVAGKRELSTLKVDTHTIRRLVWSNDGKSLISASRDKTIKVWDAPDVR